MTPQHVLVVYKKSLYRIYFTERQRQMARAEHRFSAADLARYQEADASNRRSLAEVERALAARHLRHRLVYRARHLDYGPYDLVIAVGGDGTFLEAARRVTDQPVLGVNSDPARSHGAFCACTAPEFAQTLDELLAGSARLCHLNRLALRLDGRALPYPVLNEVLAAHQSPAGMSRYRLEVGTEMEEHYGSGVWVSTAAGSSGAIRSAGGRKLALGSRRLQYLPRELYEGRWRSYRLTGGSVARGTPLAIVSHMREGLIWLDGPHLRCPFPYGARLELAESPHPLRLVQRAAGAEKSARTAGPR